MGLDSLARRLGLASPSAVFKLEQHEASGAITLRRLREVADALGCEVVVTFLPREPLSEQIKKQALAKAHEQVQRINHSMQLEAQGVSARDLEDMERSYAEELIRKGGTALWG